MNRFGLLGRTLAHSFSEGYFREKFLREGTGDALYQNFELDDIAGLPFLLKRYTDLVGLNVTIPFKEAVLPYLSECDAVVKAVGACNCIRVEKDRLLGFNTDVAGFRKALEPQLKPHHQKALVLGTGGASKAVQYVLHQLSISFRLVSRQAKGQNLGYDDLSANVLAEHFLLINATPLGTYPQVDAAPPIPYQLLTPQHFLFDLVYNPAETRFLREGKNRGAQTANGYTMLVEQAEAAWRIWTGT